MRVITRVLALVLCAAAATSVAERNKRGRHSQPDASKEGKAYVAMSDKFAGWAALAKQPLGPDKTAAEKVQRFFEQFYNSDRICAPGNVRETTVSIRNRGPGEGLGSLLNGYMISAMQTLQRGKRLCAHQAWSVYINKETCPSQSWDCLFEAVSESCPCARLREPGAPLLETVAAKRCTFSKDEEPMVSEKGISNGVTFFAYEALKEHDASLPIRSDHWYMSQLYHYYLRPNEELRAYFENLKRDLFPDWDPKRTVSAHIRRGDHWMGVHLGDEEYLHALRRTAEAVGAHTVFLGTDDMQVLETYPALLKPLKVIFLPANYSVLGQLAAADCQGRNKACRAAKLLREKSSSDEGKLLMSQIYLMKETAVTIGTIGSNFGRVIHQLQWADKALRGDRVTPGLSFLEITGDHYFSCGWRLSAHATRDASRVVEEWVQRYKYWAQAQEKA